MVKQNYICEVCDSSFDKQDDAIAHKEKPILEDDFNGVVVRDEMNNGYIIFVKKDQVTKDHTRMYSQHTIRINNHKKVENFPEDYSFIKSANPPSESILKDYGNDWSRVTNKELELVSVLLKSPVFSDLFTENDIIEFRTMPAYQGHS